MSWPTHLEERQTPEDTVGQRASLALKFLAVVNVLGFILASVPGLEPASLLAIVAFNAAGVLLAAVYVSVAWALDRGRPWAAPTARALLVVLLIWGAYSFVAALVGGAFRIPIVMLTAGLALLLPGGRAPLVRPDRRGGAIILVTVALLVLQTANQPLFGWGGLFDVRASDLHAALTVDCGVPGAGPPESLTISYEWSWSRSAPLPNDQDQVVFGWNGDGADGHPLYVLGQMPNTEPGIYPGIANGASNAMAREVGAAWRSKSPWRLDLHALGIAPGRIELQLQRTAAQLSATQELVLGASYVHVGVWHQEVPMVTCRW